MNTLILLSAIMMIALILADIITEYTTTKTEN